MAKSRKQGWRLPRTSRPHTHHIPAIELEVGGVGVAGPEDDEPRTGSLGDRRGRPEEFANGSLEVRAHRLCRIAITRGLGSCRLIIT